MKRPRLILFQRNVFFIFYVFRLRGDFSSRRSLLEGEFLEMLVLACEMGVPFYVVVWDARKVLGVVSPFVGGE
jgi:hypothetical protein